MKKNAKPKAPPAVREYMASLGSLGGKTKGPSKARTPEQARKAVLARWKKRKPAK